MTFHVTGIVYNLRDIPLVKAILRFSLLGLLALFCYLGDVDPGIILTHGRANFSLFLPSLIRKLLLSCPIGF